MDGLAVAAAGASNRRVVDAPNMTGRRIAAELHLLGILLIAEHRVVEDNDGQCDVRADRRLQFSPTVTESAIANDRDDFRG